MPSSYLQGIQAAFDNQAEIVNDIYVVSSNWFVNRCPIVTRTPRVPVGSTTFSIVSRGFRPRVAALAAAVAAGDAQITLVDASPFMNGDVLELASGERVEITRRPDHCSTNSLAWFAEGRRRDHRRHRPAPTTPIRLISNSRTGSEINQNGVGAATGRHQPVLPDLAASRFRSAARSKPRVPAIGPPPASGRRSSRSRWTRFRT